MWGIIPAAGAGTRIQPLAFSKELLPVYGKSRSPRAVSDCLVERLVLAGADKICFVISSGKSDILEYYGGSAHSAALCYVVQAHPLGLCDSLFCALPVIPQDELVLVGLPDTIWYPEEALKGLPDDRLSFVLFPVSNPQHFDAVVLNEEGRVLEVQVKVGEPSTIWVWGAFKMTGAILAQLHDLWLRRDRSDEYVGTLVNAWIEEGGQAYGYRTGERYFDVGTMDGYMQAMWTLQVHAETAAK
jgi:glucose-1-phosphate thymidylyltransferase